MNVIKTLQQFYNDHIDPDGIQPHQAIRTVVAAMMAMLLYHSISWSQSYWILFSTVLIVQTYNAATPKQKWFSLIVTGMSAVTVTFVATLLGKNLVVLGIFLSLTTFITVYLNVINSDAGNAAFLVNLFCLYAGGVSVPWLETLQRTTSVFFGFLIAVIVCACLWPERLSHTIRFNISQNLIRLSEFNRALLERKQNSKAIAVRRNRLIRGFQLARQIIPSEEIQTWQILHHIEYLYEIILSLHEIKQSIEQQKILRLINKELSVLLRRLNWLLRRLAISITHRNIEFPQVSKFIHLLRTYEKYYTRHLKKFNQSQLLAFTIYIDNIKKLERRVQNITALSKRLEYLR